MGNQVSFNILYDLINEFLSKKQQRLETFLTLETWIGLS